jgi:hypothetical protein
METVLLRTRAEWRRRWPSLLTLVALIAIAGTVTLTAFAGARRTDSAPTRFMQAERTNDVFIDMGTPLTMDGVKELMSLPHFRDSTVYAAVAAFPLDRYMPTLAPIGIEQREAVGRGLLIEGRRPASDAAGEITLSETHARQLGAGVGDRIPFAAFAHEEMARCLYSEALDASCEKVFATPRLELEVVGILRTGNDVNNRLDDRTTASISMLGPGFFERYRDDVGWSILVSGRLDRGTTPESFARAVQAAMPDGVEPRIEVINASATLDAVDVLTTALLLFGAVALLAGAFAVGQAVARHVASGATDRATLSSLGAGRLLVLADAVTPLAGAALAGVALAVMGAYVASPLMPLGFARRIEPRRGFDLDATVFVLGAVAMLVLVVACAVVVAWRSLPGAPRATQSSRSPVERVATASPSAPLAVGLRHAFSPGRGERAVPTRSALFGVVAATTGVLAVLGFSAGLSHLLDTPSLYGWSYDVTRIDTDDTERVLADPAVEDVAEASAQMEVRVNGRPTPAMALRAIRGDISPAIVSGRAPSSPGEIALGKDTFAATSVHLGDTVTVEGPEGAVSMRVVGRGVFPELDDARALADGAYLHADDVSRVGLGDGFRTLVVDLRPDVDPRAFAQSLIPEGADEDEAPIVPVPPAEIEKLQQVEALPRVLAAFLAVLGAIAVAHSLVVSVRRRTGDFAVLRALGFRPRDVRAAVSWQAASLGAVGAAIGIPLGVLVGRFGWSRVAGSIGVLEVHRVPGVVLLVAVPVAVLLAIAIALLPSRRAARIHPAEVLRTE